MNQQKRPMEGLYLRDALKKLASISARADSLKYDLEPLSDEDVEFGAQPLDKSQIDEALNEIAKIATSLALEELQATTEEWYAANDSIG